LKKFYLEQCIIELLQHFISRRTMTVESISWRSRPRGGIWDEKVLLWTVRIELLHYYISRRTMMVESI
jgi:hypothetical protein